MLCADQLLKVFFELVAVRHCRCLLLSTWDPPAHTPPPPLPHYRQVYELLADRASGPGEQAVSLAQREESYQAAVLQVGTGVQPKGMTRGVVVGRDNLIGSSPSVAGSHPIF